MNLDEKTFVETVYFFETADMNFLATIYRPEENKLLECEYRFRYFREPNTQDEKSFYAASADEKTKEQTLRDTSSSRTPAEAFR